MPGNIFYWVLNMSILGSATGLIVVVLRRIRALPRFGVYLLWTLPLIRFLVPVGIGSPYSLLNFLSRFMIKTIVVGNTGSAPQYTMTNSLQAAESYFPMEYKDGFLANIFYIAGILWLIVGAAAVLGTIVSYIVTKSALKNAEPVRDNIYRSDRVSSPAVYGIFRPKIILPGNIPEADTAYILRHERIHIRRRDNLWRMIAVLTACIHWFNPLVWIFLKLFLTDMELACDAGVLKKLDDEDKKAYAAALLRCVSPKSHYASPFGGSKIQLRIQNILSYKRLTIVSGLCFATFFFILIVTVMTNAVGG